jgi:hypothetical protein
VQGSLSSRAIRVVPLQERRSPQHFTLATSKQSITVEALGFQPSEIACVTKGGFSPGTLCALWKTLSSPFSNPIPAKSNISQEI